MNLLLGLRPLKELLAGPEAEKKGDLGKAEMLKGRMPRRTPESGGGGRILAMWVGKVVQSFLSQASKRGVCSVGCIRYPV